MGEGSASEMPWGDGLGKGDLGRLGGNSPQLLPLRTVVPDPLSGSEHQMYDQGGGGEPLPHAGR